MENLTLKLTKPVNFDAATFEELTLRELIVDEMIGLEKQHSSKPTIEYDKHFFALTCGVQPDVIGQLGSRDWVRLKNFYWDKLGNVELQAMTSE